MQDAQLAIAGSEWKKAAGLKSLFGVEFCRQRVQRCGCRAEYQRPSCSECSPWTRAFDGQNESVAQQTFPFREIKATHSQAGVAGVWQRQTRRVTLHCGAHLRRNSADEFR